MKNGLSRSLITGVFAGSLWAFSEVVIGTAVRVSALPLRGTLMTATGIGILFAAFAFNRKITTLATAIFTTLAIKVTCAFFLGGLDSIINSSFAVLIEGSLAMLAIALLRIKSTHSARSSSIATAIAMLAGGTIFYIVGNHLAPCAYLKSFSFQGFFIHETLPWAITSAITAPLGYLIGSHIGKRLAQTNSIAIKPVFTTMLVCWLACALTVWLSLQS